VDGYPVGQVLNFSRAAKINREKRVMEMAVGVSLGIRDAWSSEGSLVKTWLGGLEKTAAPKPLITPRAAQFLAGLPVRKKHG